MARKLLTIFVISFLLMLTPVLAFQQGKFLNDVSPTYEREQVREQIRNRYQINITDEQLKIVEVTTDDMEITEAYLVEVNKEGKLFNLFRKRYTIREYINIDNGEVIQTKLPWYYRLMRRN